MPSHATFFHDTTPDPCSPSASVFIIPAGGRSGVQVPNPGLGLVFLGGLLIRLCVHQTRPQSLGGQRPPLPGDSSGQELCGLSL